VTFYQNFVEEVPRFDASVVLCGTLQTPRIAGKDELANACKYLFSFFSKPVEVLTRSTSKNFLVKVFGKTDRTRKSKRTSAERDVTASLVIVHDGLVVELRRADTNRVVHVGRGENEAIILQEGLDQLAVFGRRFAKRSLHWVRVESRRQLRERAVVEQLPQRAVDVIRPLGELLAAIDSAWSQMPLEFL
jgi:hypothetical protein